MELLPESAVNYALEIRAYFNATGTSGIKDYTKSMNFAGSGTTEYILGKMSNTAVTMFPTYWTIRADVSEEHTNLNETFGKYVLGGDSYCDARNQSGYSAGLSELSRKFEVYLSELSKLILAVQTADSKSNQIAAGSKLTVYGVLR